MCSQVCSGNEKITLSDRRESGPGAVGNGEALGAGVLEADPESEARHDMSGSGGAGF